MTLGPLGILTQPDKATKAKVGNVLKRGDMAIFLNGLGENSASLVANRFGIV
jgi:hypothetical protein